MIEKMGSDSRWEYDFLDFCQPIYHLFISMCFKATFNILRLIDIELQLGVGLM
jgi:hypothetical protein